MNRNLQMQWELFFIVIVVLMPLFPFFVGLYTFLLTLYLYTFAALAYREGMRRLAAPR